MNINVMAYSKPVTYHGAIQAYSHGTDRPSVTEDIWECDHLHVNFLEAIECAMNEIVRRFPEVAV
jgi:hypothetical protein